MARTINEQEHAEKRNEILAAAQRLVFTKGYERMTIQDVLLELGISSGAFYHYFDSKPDLLEALIERIQQDVEKLLLPMVHDPDLTASEKLRSFFTTIDRMRRVNQSTVIQMLYVWYADDNAIVRQKVDSATLERRAPLINQIIRQGIQEGAFKTAYPEQTGEIILSLIAAMGNTHAKLLLSVGQGHTEWECVEGIVSSMAANMTAIERILGAQSTFLDRVSAESVKEWLLVTYTEKDQGGIRAI